MWLEPIRYHASVAVDAMRCLLRKQGSDRNDQCDLLSSHQRARELFAVKLENRVLYSATPITIGMIPTDADVVQVNQEAEGQQVTTEPSMTRAERPSSLTVIDGGVHAAEEVARAIRQSEPESRVIVLSEDADGIEQISKALQSHKDLQSIRVFSHGTAGELRLGTTRMSEGSLAGYAGELALWRNALAADADLLLYGCNVAQSPSGETMLRSIAALTGADVAASDDVTGNAVLGGNWELEYQTGSIEAVWTGHYWQETFSTTLNAGITGDLVEYVAAGTASEQFNFNADGQNRLLLVAVAFGKDNGEEVNSITFNGDTLQRIADGESTSPNNSRVELWALVNPDSGSHSLDVQFSGTSHDGAYVIANNLIHVDQLNPFTDPQSSVAITGNATLTSTPTEQLIVSVAAQTRNLNQNLDAGANQTLRHSEHQGSTNVGFSTQHGYDSNVSEWSADSNGIWAAASITINRAPIIVDTAEDYLSFDGKHGATGSALALYADRGTDGLINLREAIKAANSDPGLDRIQFDIGAGSQVINPVFLMTAIEDEVVIDGWSHEGYASNQRIILDGRDWLFSGLRFEDGAEGSIVRGLTIRDFGFSGIELVGSSTQVSIIDNWIGGFDNLGNIDAASGNSYHGIYIEGSDHVVGGSEAEANIIAHNGRDGISIASGTGNQIRRNTIFGNGQFAIDLGDNDRTINDGDDSDAGPNNLVNFPAITTASRDGNDFTVAGQLTSTATTSFSLDFFGGTGDNDARHYLGTISGITDGTGSFTFSQTLTAPLPGSVTHLVATATDGSGNTSELSDSTALTAPIDPPDADAGGPYVINEGQSLDLDATASTDPRGLGLTYQWDLDNDGNFGEAGEPTSATATVAWSTLVSLGIAGNATHTISVRVDDGTNQDQQSVSLTINNVDPQFSAPSLNVNVDENSTAVTTVSATDPVDALTYSIIGGSDSARFNVTSGGVLTFVAAPDFESPNDANGDNVYEVIVEADDGDGGTTSQTVNVLIGNLNDNGPVIDPNQAFSLAEDATASQTIGTVTTQDPDNAAGPALTFSIESGNANSIFEIDAATGVLAVDNPAALDFESQAFHDLTIRVSDGVNTATTETVRINITDANDAATGSVTVTGIPTQGNQLSADVSAISDQDGIGTFTYQWQRGGVNISGANQSIYTLTQQDVGQSIQVVVVLTDARGSTEPNFTSPATALVANVNDPATGTVSISGVVEVGRTLTADVASLADADGIASLNYQWTRDGVSILGATNTTYQMVASDIDADIRVRVQLVDAFGFNEGWFESSAVRTGPVSDVASVAVGLADSSTSQSRQTSTVQDTQSSELIDGSDAETSESEQAESETVSQSSQSESDSQSTQESSDGERIDASKVNAKNLAQNASGSGGEKSATTVVLTDNASVATNNSGSLAGGEGSAASTSRASGVPIGRSVTAGAQADMGLAAASFQLTTVARLSATDIAILTGPGELWDAMDQSESEVAATIRGDLVMTGSAAAAASGITMGIIAWTLRSGLLLSGLLAQLPAWRGLDPLIVMQGFQVNGDSESLEEMMQRRDAEMAPER